MGMQVVLCALSPARQAMLEEEPELLDEVLESRREVAIPGLVDLGKAWDALDRIVTGGRADGPLADAVLGRGGRPWGRRGAFGKPRLLDNDRVKVVHAALAELPDDVVKKRYRTLAGKGVHGDYGQEVAAQDDPAYLRDKVQKTHQTEIAELEGLFRALRESYAKAAQSGQAMLVTVG